MKIESGKKYKIKGNSLYFRTKYKTSNPVIEIEDSFLEMQRHSGSSMSINDMAGSGHPACFLYCERSVDEGLPLEDEADKDVYYGKIEDPAGHRMGELVHKSELEEI